MRFLIQGYWLLIWVVFVCRRLIWVIWAHNNYFNWWKKFGKLIKACNLLGLPCSIFWWIFLSRNLLCQFLLPRQLIRERFIKCRWLINIIMNRLNWWFYWLRDNLLIYIVGRGIVTKNLICKLILHNQLWHTSLTAQFFQSSLINNFLWELSALNYIMYTLIVN